ncbi:MAG: GtrA family protein [Candidatus Sphingomonas colombiensis]|nr:GtrA family protein [Sphingomonas sp.]WEK44551.1 MAG: GtrA family protein [Sphingomonas sp.]
MSGVIVPRNGVVLGQLIRFAIAGLLSASVYAGVYLFIARMLPPVHAALAVPPAFVVAVICSFFLHSAWSFRGHGSRDASGRQHLKFFVVQLAQLSANLAVTWLLTGWLHAPTWVPLIPAIGIVPFVTFYVQRRWVFG